MASTAPPTTAFSRTRIHVLRGVFFAFLPLIFFTTSGWETHPWIAEVIEILGIYMIIAGVLGRFWAILYIGGHKSQTVMQIGPYSMCRHPLYFYSTIGATGFGLMLGSFVLAALLGGITFLILRKTAMSEEAFLRHRFGDAYDRYAARVPRIWPKPSLFTTPEHVEFNVKHLRGNLNDAFIFLGFIPLAELVTTLHAQTSFPTFVIY